MKYYYNSHDHDKLVKDLESEDRNIRLSTVRKLGKSRDERIIKHLICALKDNDPDIRLEASNSLYNFGPIIVDELISLLNEDNLNLRLNLIELLGEIGDNKAIESILPFLNDENIFVRIAAVRSLGGFDDEQIIEPLIANLNDKSYMLRNAIVEVLGSFNNEKAKDALEKCLDDESYIVRETAKEAIVFMKANYSTQKGISNEPDSIEKEILGIDNQESLLDPEELVITEKEIVKDEKDYSFKTCGKCGESKPRTEFYNNKIAKDGLTNYCKGCMRNYTPKGRVKPKGRIKPKEKPKSKGNPLKLLREIR